MPVAWLHSATTPPPLPPGRAVARRAVALLHASLQHASARRGATLARAGPRDAAQHAPTPSDDDLGRRAAAALEGADAAYHGGAGDESPLSDGAYDALKRAAVAAGAVDAAKVGHPVPDGAAKVAHPAPMLSLDSVASRADADAWARRTLARLAKAGDGATATAWTAEPKVDGLALRLSYAGGRLVQAATRGDGAVGEDVTAAVAARVDGVPAALAGYGGDAEVRGEAYMTHAEFAAANAAATAAGAPSFANPRNLAAATLRAGGGAARTAAADAADRRRLSFAAYGLTLPPGTPGAPTTHTECVAWLAARGVDVAAPVLAAPTLAAALDSAADWMATRASLPYDADGAVVKADSLAAQAALGCGPSAPRWAVAWKFPPVDAVTTLTGVTWQLGRTGALVPVAELAPVAVGGVTVARASLHNLAVARRLGARVGDAVVVRRAGDVVPQVVAAVAAMRTGTETEWEPPTVCPACGGALEHGPAGATSAPDTDALRCVARACPGRSLKRVQHFAACVASDGVGPATVAAIVDAGAAADAADLVALDAAALAQLPRFGAKRAAAVAAALAAAADAPPASVLAGLAIPGVGKSVAALLLGQYGSIAALAAAAARGGGVDVSAVPGVGPAVAAAVDDWFAVDDNVALVDRLLAAGVGTARVPTRADKAMAEAEAADAVAGAGAGAGADVGAGTATSLPLSGLTFVVTGAVYGMTRDDAHAAIAAAGGKAVSSVSGRVAAVVVGDAPGATKLNKAAELGVPVVDAEEFFGEDGGVAWSPPQA